MKDNQLLNGAAIYFLVIVLGIIASGFIKANKKYKVANHDVFEKTLYDGFLLKFHELSSSNIDDFLFVDLRDKAEFEAGHLEGAINITADNVLDKESLKILRKAKNQVVFYSDSQEKSVAINMLLYSAGIKNTRVLAGNYDLAKGYYSASEILELRFYDQEKAKWNYGAFFKTTPAQRNEPPITPPMLQLMGGC